MHTRCRCPNCGWYNNREVGPNLKLPCPWCKKAIPVPSKYGRVGPVREAKIKVTTWVPEKVWKKLLRKGPTISQAAAKILTEAAWK